LIQRLEGSRYVRFTLCLFNRESAPEAFQKMSCWQSAKRRSSGGQRPFGRREGNAWSLDALLLIVPMHVEGSSFGSGGLMRRMGLGPVENEGEVARH